MGSLFPKKGLNLGPQQWKQSPNHWTTKEDLMSYPLVWGPLGQITEKAMAPHSNTLAWKIPWTEEPGGLQSMGSLRVGHDWVTSLSCIGEGNGNPLQCSCLENPRDRGAWWAAVYGVAQSRTLLTLDLAAAAVYKCLVQDRDGRRGQVGQRKCSHHHFILVHKSEESGDPKLGPGLPWY